MAAGGKARVGGKALLRQRLGPGLNELGLHDVTAQGSCRVCKLMLLCSIGHDGNGTHTYIHAAGHGWSW